MQHLTLCLNWVWSPPHAMHSKAVNVAPLPVGFSTDFKGTVHLFDCCKLRKYLQFVILFCLLYRSFGEFGVGVWRLKQSHDVRHATRNASSSCFVPLHPQTSSPLRLPFPCKHRCSEWAPHWAAATWHNSAHRIGLSLHDICFRLAVCRRVCRKSYIGSGWCTEPRFCVWSTFWRELNQSAPWSSMPGLPWGCGWQQSLW